LSKSFNQNFKIGILGGGQLGRMLIQSGIDYNLSFAVLDPDEHAPCNGLADFHVGKLTDFDTVLKFGSTCDIITIEIEHVNTQALKRTCEAGEESFFRNPRSLR
jgi:5-(carboxyamino)imidazole ribonucleotide synthase